jgi:hypothetical protein
MAEEENHIDQLFKKKLSDHVSAPPEDIWEGIESAIPKSLFFRFRYEYMNVYYAGLIAGCFLFSGGALVYSIKNYYKTVQVNVVDVEEEDSLSLHSSGSSAEDGTEQGNRRIRKNRFYGLSPQEQKDQVEEETRLAEEQKIKDSLAAITSPLIADTAKQISQPLHTSAEEKPKPKKPKKVVYITDYDTIVKYDTLRTKKKRK